MGSEWPTYALTDLYSVSSGLSKPAKDFGEGHPFVSFKDVFYNFFLPDELSQLVKSSEKEQDKCSVRRGDVFLTRTSETMEDLGMSCVARKDYPNATFNGFSKRLRPSTELPIHPEYVGYYLRTPQFRNEMLAFSTMSTRASLNNDMIGRLQITLPPLPEQKAIAHILGTLDDKIGLNRRMNATLEGMAQALFKSWFVDFDPVIDNALAAGNPIPDELAPRAEVRKKALANGTTQQGSVDHPTLSDPKSFFPAAFQFTEELGWIPGGWEVSEIENSTSTIIDHRGKTPKKLGHDWTESGIPAVSAKNIKDGKLVRKDTIKFTDSALYDRWMVDELQKGDVLMTSEAPLGEKLYLAKQVKWVLSQRLFALRANDQISGVYLYHWLNTDIAKADIDGRASGTTVQGIRQSELKKIKVLTPDAKSIGAFSNACDALMEKRATNEENTGQLTNLRDTLLPRLISGELSVSTGLEEMALAT